MQIIISTVVIRHGDDGGKSTGKAEERLNYLLQKEKIDLPKVGDVPGLVSRSRCQAPGKASVKYSAAEKHTCRIHVQSLPCLPFKFRYRHENYH